MIETTAVCGWMPGAPYVNGPLDGNVAPPLRRKTETVHPTHRTADGRSVREGTVPTPSSPCYVHREYPTVATIHDTAGYYEWLPCLGPEIDHSCVTCGLTEDTTDCEGLFFNHAGQMGCEDPRCETPWGPVPVDPLRGIAVGDPDPTMTSGPYCTVGECTRSPHPGRWLHIAGDGDVVLAVGIAVW